MACAQAQAAGDEADDAVRIGLLLDMSGIYADSSGPGSVVAVKMAVADFGGRVLGRPIEIVVADHQNKPDVAAAISRRWFESEKVVAVMDAVGSAPALAAIEIAKSYNKIIVINGAGAIRITNEACMPSSVHWAFDTYALSHGTAKAMLDRGYGSWFFISADYAFGRDLEQGAADVVRANGGKVLGSVHAPMNTSDFSSFLLQAQASKAQVIAFANAGGDTVNATKQAAEFGMMGGNQKIVGLLVLDTDVKTLGLAAAQGMLVTTPFYWDRNEETRAWGRQFIAETKSIPTMTQAGAYSSTLHYLKAVEAAGTVETNAVMEKMRAIPVNDMFAKNGIIREDGRMIHDMYLYEVKSPSESKGPWDFYKFIATIPANETIQPLSESRCPLLKN